MKSILIVTAVFPPEPVVSARLSKDLADELAKKYPVIVLCPKPTRPAGFDFSSAVADDGKYQREEMPSKVCPESRIFGRMAESWSFGKHCAKYIRKHRAAIGLIYLNSWPIFSQMLIEREAKHWKIPAIVHIQDIYPDSLLKKIKSVLLQKLIYFLFLPADRWIQRNAARVIAISENMRNEFMRSRRTPAEKMSIVSNWQDESEFLACKERENTADECVFMYLGNNGPVARVDWLIRCFAKAGLKNGRFVVAGSGSRKDYCMNEAAKYPDAGISFMDVPCGKVAEVQSRADVMILAVESGAALSSIPSKIPAYMLSRKPILAALDAESDTARIIRDSKGGIVVPPAEEAALIRGMRMFASMSESQRKEMGECSFAYAIRHFSKQKNLQQLCGIIEKEYHAYSQN